MYTSILEIDAVYPFVFLANRMMFVILILGEILTLTTRRVQDFYQGLHDRNTTFVGHEMLHKNQITVNQGFLIVDQIELVEIG